MIYSIDVKLYATAYIRAKNDAEALKKVRALRMQGLELREQDGDIPICGLTFDNPDLPDLSLAPTMTIHGPDRGARPALVDE